MLDAFDCVLQSGLDGFFGQGRIASQDVLGRHSPLDEFEDGGYGNPGIFENGSPPTDFTIDDDVAVHVSYHQRYLLLDKKL